MTDENKNNLDLKRFHVYLYGNTD